MNYELIYSHCLKGRRSWMKSKMGGHSILFLDQSGHDIDEEDKWII